MAPNTLTVVNYVFDPALTSPELLLHRYDALTDWCRAVARRGMRVRLVQAFSSDAAFTTDNVEWVFRTVASSSSHRIAHLHDAVLSHAPDVVHVNGLETVAQTWRLRRVLPEATALVVQHHGGTAPQSRLSTFVKGAFMGDIDGYLFTSRQQAAPWIATGLIPDDAVQEVLEASTSFHPMNQAEARERTGVHGTPAVLWVGRLQPNKDPLTVLDGFFRCADRLPASTLTMVFREADLLSAVQQLVAEHRQHAARVRLVGEVARHEMPAWYSAADIFVLGSASEVCGYSALEACACGTVPVLSDIAPFQTITGHGAIGRLWRRGDPQAFADALVEACAGLTGDRARVMEHFSRNLSWDAVARQACDAYVYAHQRRARAHRAP